MNHFLSRSIAKHSLIVLIVFTAVGQVKAQDINSANLTWTINKSHDLTANEDYEYHCTFKTSSQPQIIWSQNQGELVSHIDINQISGSWADVSKPGSVTFRITVSGVQGSLTFLRDASGVFILLNLDGDPDPFYQKYEVTSIQNN